MGQFATGGAGRTGQGQARCQSHSAACADECLDNVVGLVLEPHGGSEAGLAGSVVEPFAGGVAAASVAGLPLGETRVPACFVNVNGRLISLKDAPIRTPQKKLRLLDMNKGPA